MLQRELNELLQDILDYSALTRTLADKGGFAAYSSDDERRLAIERGLQIVGEALSQATSLRRDLIWHISDMQEIIAFRHLLTHHYFKITPRVVWGIILDDLPVLEREIASVIAQPFGHGEEDPDVEQ